MRKVGDSVCDLSIVTRVVKQPLKESGRFQRMLAVYNEAAGASWPDSAVHIHELLIHPRCLDTTMQAGTTGKLEEPGQDQ